MEVVNEEGLDTLVSLEQRIQDAVEVLTSLRKENESLRELLAVAQSEREDSISALESVRKQLSSSEAEVGRLSHELGGLREERKQVKVRIEKLLGQMELLSAS